MTAEAIAPPTLDMAELIEQALTGETRSGDAYNRLHQYSTLNRMFLMMQGCPPEPVTSFKGWQQVDRHVVKGAKAFSVIRPITVKGNRKPTITIAIARQQLRVLLEQVEIALLRDTALGFESEILPEYEMGGRAAIAALRAMADHKERMLIPPNSGELEWLNEAGDAS